MSKAAMQTETSEESEISTGTGEKQQNLVSHLLLSLLSVSATPPLLDQQSWPGLHPTSRSKQVKETGQSCRNNRQKQNKLQGKLCLLNGR
jgi:hypothetical protein